MARIFQESRVVAWGECDPAGIIFYPTYYHWMDAAAGSLLARCGWPAQRMRDEHLAMPLVDSQCAFVSSPTFGDTCEVRVSVARLGRSSFGLQYEFFLQGQDKLLARGSESRVWCRYQAGPGSPLRSLPMPAELRAALGEAPPA
ncbi:acyl-CoA thioesterase [Ramlibacter tataouinensis]|uniref:acyl-CoA thioesterase n=1 Tax=Ramlibacter tataouinensis TaxID=94132 RepID=UPI0022F3DD66|nr:acyl-CoA thioesterase [Ramlibacter tataouinensis]WBY03399.1 acyl-CoA thioesterase [Ramlibacter tataouinensis]